MKKIIYAFSALLLAGVVAFSSCDKVKDLVKVNFNLENASGEFSVPALTAVGEVSLGTDDVYINLDSIIKAQNAEVNSKNIKEVRLTSCELVLQNGDAKNNFSALESCKLQLASNVKPEFITMASVENNPDVVAYTLVLPVDNSLDLKDYFLNATTFSYKVSGKTRKTTDKPLDCKIVVKYNIVAGL